MTWTFDLDLYSRGSRKDIDTSKSREKIKMIHLLVYRGAKWIPRDRNDINDSRRALLKMRADYTVEFFWINNIRPAHVKRLITIPLWIH